jgi:uncharacterized protein with HEPN domain
MYSFCEKALYVWENLKKIDALIKKYKKVSILLEDDLLGKPAVLMFLMQIGETLNSINKKYPDLIEAYDLQIEAKGSYNVRNFIAHDYEGVNLALIEKVLKEDLEVLKKKIKRLINDNCK